MLSANETNRFRAPFAVVVLAIFVLAPIAQPSGSDRRKRGSKAVSANANKPRSDKEQRNGNKNSGQPNPRPGTHGCSCSCGKDEQGGCLGHYSGCSTVDGIECMMDCCANTPLSL